MAAVFKPEAAIDAGFDPIHAGVDPIPAGVDSIHAGVDPIQLEIIKGALISTQGECEALLERTSMSPIIREKLDFFIGILDGVGRLVVGTKMPLFGAILDPVLAHYPITSMRPGDMYLYNDCYGSGGSVSHSPDLVFVSPVFSRGEIIAFAHSWAHFYDIGGGEPGSLSPRAPDVLAEGIIIPPVMLARDGKLIDEIFRILVRNSRFPEMIRGDVRAMMASVRLGEKRMLELVDRFGHDVLLAAFDGLIHETERGVRNRMQREFRDGIYRFCDSVDDDGNKQGPFTLRMTMTVKDGDVSIDATRSDPQAKGPINFLMRNSVPKLVFGMLTTADDRDMLLNHGAIDAFGEVKLGQGTILQPNFPAPLGQRMITLQRVLSTCAGLYAQARGKGAMASSSSYVLYYLRGYNPKENERFHETGGMGVGHGARSFADGHNAIYFGPVKNYPVEFLEQSYPVRVRAYGINLNSGGPGEWRGGCGIIREFEVLIDGCTLGLRMDNVINAPWGVSGGMSGRSGRFIFNPGRPDERELPRLSDGIQLNAGDVLRIESPGGGGFGHPFDRDPGRVLEDVLNGLVSREMALADYGVALSEDEESVDPVETVAYRGANRWDTRMFHRGRYYDADEWYQKYLRAG
ncbi:MAG: hydantoinase B/oxoprolinase family protein [Betaproteobacteria bacterium]|nr:hydantoinase B/oxoprolinase family protein [Betaproteobacteria bacterium]